MNPPPSPSQYPLAIPLVTFVDRVCDRFEEAWPVPGSGCRRPRIEDYLTDLREPSRSHVLRELLKMETAYRRDAGEQPTPEEYERRFPQHLQLIHLVFHWPEPTSPGTVALPRTTGELTWYYAQDKRKRGPLSWERLRRLVAAGHLRPTDMVWQKGMRRWLNAAAVPGLFPQATASFEVAAVPRTMVSPQADLTKLAPGNLASTAPYQSPAAAVAVESFPNVPGFEILKVLGQGGMGVVYLARNVRAKRVEALKMIRADCLAGLPGTQRQALSERFRTEYQAAARIQHDHVVTVFTVGESGGSPFYSMRYVEGRSLHDVLQEGPSPNQRAAALLEGVARAVHFIHGHHILHRDIKPRNIMVDAADRPYVTDFGLAKWLEAAQGMTHTGEAVGTPSYMAPEQAQDASRVTVASDVYSLGATLYALLTGRPPFQAATVAETLHQVKYDEPVAPQKLNPAIAKDLETITLKCLHKEPGRRYSTAEELADDLRRYREGRPILARPAGQLERSWRWCRRNPVVAGLLGVVVLLIVLVPVVALVGYLNTLAAYEEKKRESARFRQQRDLVENLYYLAGMREGGQALQMDDLHRVQELVKRHRPSSDSADNRGWEWHYLNRLTDAFVFAVPGAFLGWSPDGKWLATFEAGQPSGTIKIWKTATGEEVYTVPRSNFKIWGPDGHTLVAETDEGNIKLLNLATGKETVCRSRSPSKMGPYYQGPALFDWSPDNRWLVARKANGTPKIWDLTDGAEKMDLPAQGNFLTWAAQGQRLYFHNLDGTIQFWEMKTGKATLLADIGKVWINSLERSPDRRWLPIRVNSSPQNQEEIAVLDTTAARIHFQLKGLVLAWRPDSRRLAAAGKEGTITIWDPSSGRQTLVLQGLLPQVGSMVWSPDGRLLAALAADGTVRAWDTKTGQGTIHMPFRKLHSSPAISSFGWSVTWSPDCQRLTLSHPQFERRIISAATGKEQWTVSGVIVTSPDEKRMISSAANSTTILKDISSPGRGITLPIRASGHGAWSPDSKLLAWDDNARGPNDLGAVLPGIQTHRRAVKVWSFSAVNMGAWHALPGFPHAWSPDGQRMASFKQTPFAIGVSVWDLAAEKEVFSLGEWQNIGNSGGSLLWSPDGQRLATLCGPKIQIWDTATGKKLLSSWTSRHGIDEKRIAWRPDGKRLAFVNQDGKIQVWDVSRGKELLTITLKGNPELISWSPNGKRLASYEWTGEATTQVWNATTGQEAVTLEEPPINKKDVFARQKRFLRWSPDSRRLAGAEQRGIRIWDMATGRETCTVQGHWEAAVWSPDGRRLHLVGRRRSGNNDVNEIRDWDAARENELPGVSLRELKGAAQFQWSPGGQYLVSIAWNQIKGWDRATGKETFALPEALLSWSPDGKQFAALATADANSEKTWPISIRQAKTGKEVRKLRLQGNAGKGPLRLTWSPDGRRLAGGVGTGWAKIWEATTGKDVCSILGIGEVQLHAVAWSPDGRQLVTGSTGGNITVWDAATGKQRRNFWGGQEDVSTLAWNPDSHRLASWSSDGTVMVWDTATWKEAFKLVGPPNLELQNRQFSFDIKVHRLLAWSPNGRWLAAAGGGGEVTVCDAAHGKEFATLRGHAGMVRALTWNPDSQYLASASADKTVMIWNVNTRKQEHILRGHSSIVLSAAWSRDGRRLVSASDKEVIGWDTGTWQHVITLEELMSPVCWRPQGDRLAVLQKGGTFNPGGFPILLDGTPSSN